MNNDIFDYNQAQNGTAQEVCEILHANIAAALPNANAKLYHANPVWFIDDNPVVGYDVLGDHVNLLFWSGQSFTEPGLTAAGKFKAAGTKYLSVSDVDVSQLQSWLRESLKVQWNYRDLRANNGDLIRL